MPFIHGRISDEVSGEPLEAKVHCVDSGGRTVQPEDAILKVGPGLEGFYADGEFTIDVPSGYTTLRVERGTEYSPFIQTIRTDTGPPTEMEIHLKRWNHLPNAGWYPGNTHIHYNEEEKHPDQRLHLDPRVHDLRVSVISVLQRDDLPYASNKFPVGMLTDFTSAHHLVDCGEENRHNTTPWEIGYGHVIFLNLVEAVLPISRGVLVNDQDPDYPPLVYACNQARDQGGLAIWCHNGVGMEAPVAAILGKLDAFNLFDPYWVIPEEYSIWYHLLNCGIHLPASTGSDWFICSNNRVYVKLDGEFSYEAWLRNMQAGRTFITNGPALHLMVNDHLPGDSLTGNIDSSYEIQVEWRSYFPIENMQVIWNGNPIKSYPYPKGSQTGSINIPFTPGEDGWLAARVSSTRRDSFNQPVFAHTSPVWIQSGKPPMVRKLSAKYFERSLNNSMDWVRNTGRYANQQQKREVLDLFKEAQAAYQQMI